MFSNCKIAKNATNYRLNSRLFISNRVVFGNSKQKKSDQQNCLKWKEQQLKRNNKKKNFIPKSEFDNGKDTGMAAGFKAYIENLILATVEEKKEVLAKEQLLNSSLPCDLLELRGLALISLVLDTSFLKITGKEVQVKLVREGSKCLPDGGWRRGMLVTLELEGVHGFGGTDSWRRKNGVLVDVGSQWVIVSLDNLDSWVLETFTGQCRSGGIRIVKRSEDGIYKRNLDQLKYLLKYPLNFKQSTPQGYIFSNLLELELLTPPYPESPPESLEENNSKEQNLVIFNKKLLTDSSKHAALTACASCPPVSVIHGPPGTGKTTTLAAAVLSAVANGEKVLVVAPSHAACDAFTTAVAEYWPGGDEKVGKLIRLGNKLRLTTKRVEKFLPENVYKSDELSEIDRKLRFTRSELMEGGKGKGHLVQLEAILASEYEKTSKKLENEAIEKAAVVVCTIMTATRNHIQQMMIEGSFHLVCVDEAGFTVDSHLVPVVARARRIILAGDHKQLPPVVLSQEGKDRGLGISLLERIAKHCPDCVTMLTTQYRSHQLISEWSSHHFYGGNLLADSANSGMLLNQLLDLKNVSMQERIWTDTPMVWLDSKNCRWEEQAEDEESVCNCDEAVMVTDIINRLLQLGVRQDMIGVISPYWAQVGLIRSLVWEGDGKTEVEVRTVDGFQGREKEVILLSLVRSNNDGVVGFLSESRRVNVSVTRARRCCIIIGDSGTLRNDSGLESLWRFCDSRNLLIPVDEVVR